MKIAISAAETSGDLIGAKLVIPLVVIFIIFSSQSFA
jgi:lipid A disaccharide synthetase